MTWHQLTSGLRVVQSHGVCEARTALALFELGYIEGSNRDAAGLTLTERGQTILEHIDRDTRHVEAELAALAHAFALVYADRRPSIH